MTKSPVATDRLVFICNYLGIDVGLTEMIVFSI